MHQDFFRQGCRAFFQRPAHRLNTDGAHQAARRELAGEQLERPAGAALRGRAAADGDELRLDVAVDLRRHRRGLAGLALEGGPLAAGDEGLADAGDGVEVHAERRGDLGVGAMAVGAVAVAEQEDLGVSDLLGGGVPVAGDLVEALALLGREPDGVLVGREHEEEPLPGAGRRSGCGFVQ